MVLLRFVKVEDFSFDFPHFAKPPDVSRNFTNMNFSENKDKIIEKLKTSTTYKNDNALKRIVEILEEIKTPKELNKYKDLINRIAIDSVEDWENINLISEFVNTGYKSV